MIHFTDDFMRKSLARFGEDYKYPVFASIYCRSGFFSRYKAQTGFVAVTDDERLLIMEYSVFNMNGKKYTFSFHDLKSLEIKKLRLLPVYSVKSVFKPDGKTIKLDISVSLKVSGGEFPEQERNAMNLIEILENLRKYTKE